MKMIFLCLFLSVLFHSFLLSAADGEQESIPSMKISVWLDLEGKLLKGSARVSPAALKANDILVSGIDIQGIDAGRVSLPFETRDGRLKISGSGILDAADIEIHFSKRLDLNGISPHRESQGGNLAEGDFVVLLSQWCPVFDRLAVYELEVHVDQELVAMSEADRVKETREDSGVVFRFDFPYPRESLSLVAGRFFLEEKEVAGVTIATYFLQDDRALAGRFLSKTAYYLELYSKLISPYPYKRFAVVENLATSGISLPTFTLIGRSILRMPFVMNISLGHEVLHSWFGNSVYVDYSSGNWCEGLTTYLADYYYEEIEGRGIEYRHRILCDYKSYVNNGMGFPLISFQTASNRLSKAIGYGKCAMFFHQLRRLTGDDAFFRAVSEFSKRYRFRKARWEDLKHTFARVSRLDMESIFAQWLERNDIPVLSV